MKIKKLPVLNELEVLSSKEFFDIKKPFKEGLYQHFTRPHIESTRGLVERVIHEPQGSALCRDVLIIPPNSKHDYYTLVTYGMCFNPMPPPPTNLPTHTHAELYMHLPRDWKLDEQSLQQSKWSWPVAWLLYMARYPHLNQKWIGWRTCVECEDSGSMGDSKFAGCLLLSSLGECPDFEIADLSLFQQIFFYNLLPVYKEEMVAFAQADSCGDAARLEDLFIVNQLNGPVNTKRKNVITNASY